MTMLLATLAIFVLPVVLFVPLKPYLAADVLPPSAQP